MRGVFHLFPFESPSPLSLRTLVLHSAMFLQNRTVFTILSRKPTFVRSASQPNPVLSNLIEVLHLRKEVIQPHLPIRLPCYDFTPIIYPTLGGWLLKGYLTDFGCYKLSWCDGRCVQGPGTYSPRRADPRLLAIPTSCRRVAAYNPN